LSSFGPVLQKYILMTWFCCGWYDISNYVLFVSKFLSTANFCRWKNVFHNHDINNAILWSDFSYYCEIYFQKWMLSRPVKLIIKIMCDFKNLSIALQHDFFLPTHENQTWFTWNFVKLHPHALFEWSQRPGANHIKQF
jgi:hypothetical protein